MYNFETTSYYVNKSEVFSDGKTENDPPTPEDPKILICSACNKPFWKEEAVLSDQEIDDSTTDLPEANSIYDLFPGFKEDHLQKHIQFYIDLLEKDFANTEEKEIYIRIKIWHLLNDRIRYHTSAVFGSLFRDHKKQTDPDNTNNHFKNNLLRLTEIFKPDTYESQLLLAEMYREFEDYSKALLVIHDLKNPVDSRAYNQIYNAIKRKNKDVFLIK
jgi:hypothetical protein